MLRDARENGCAVSMLAPFKPSFYERLGYVAVNGSQTVTFNPEALAAYRHRAQPDHTLERCLGDPGRQRMFTLVETHPEWLHHGQVWFDSVRHPRFERRFRNSCSVFVQDQGRDIGVLTYLKNGDCLEVLLLGAESRSALVALLGYLAAHRDQVPNLRFHLPPGTRFWEWIGDTRHLEVRQNANPWQVRILDTVTALQGHSCSRPGCLVVEIEDELCPWTAGRYRLEVCDARLSVTPCGPGTEVVDARADQRALAALLYGAASCETLTWREWLSVSKPDTGVLLDTWFPVQTMDSMVHF
jgi:predicted acetyltransferase